MYYGRINGTIMINALINTGLCGQAVSSVAPFVLPCGIRPGVPNNLPTAASAIRQHDRAYFTTFYSAPAETRRSITTGKVFKTR